MSKNVDLSSLSDGELLDLVVPSESSNRRVLVMWLYLREQPEIGLGAFDSLLASLAEKELQRRSISMTTELGR
jgi:hypothetical protein